MISKDPNFEKKIEEAKAGGQEVIAALLEVYRPWLLRLAENDLRSKIRPILAASDVVQGSIILAINAFPDFRGRSEAELHVWLRRILQNHLVDGTRAALAKKRTINQDLAVDKEELVDLLTPSKIASNKEETARLLQAITELDPKLRAVLELRYLKNLPFDVIGQELNISRDKANRRWHLAIEILARKMR